MKKFIVFVIGLSLLLGFSTPDAKAANDQEFCEQFEGVKKIWWDGIELKPGQIGRLIVVKDTPLFKLQGEKKVLSRTLKAGEFYRIYAFKSGMLSVGGGFYVDRDTKVKYETPSKTKLRAVQCIHNPYGSKGNPTVMGDYWVMRGEDSLDGYKHYEIGMKEAITNGDLAWQMIQQANMYNEAPPAGKKYVLAKFWVKLIEFEGKTFDSFNVNPTLFEAVSKSGTVYNRSIIVEPQPNLSEIYEGGRTEGWVAFLVDENDDPRIVWNRGLGDELWFQLK